jgi:hypothetical protein
VPEVETVLIEKLAMSISLDPFISKFSYLHLFRLEIANVRKREAIARIVLTHIKPTVALLFISGNQQFSFSNGWGSPPKF